MLSAKIYHNHMVKHAFEAKRKMGLKVDEAVMDFYRTQPDDADLKERRRLERARAEMANRLQVRKRDKQLSSIFAAATQLAAKQDAESAAKGTSSYRLTHALAEIGVQLPLNLQIGLPYGDDDVYLSEEDARSEDTASAPGSDNEADIDDLLDELDAKQSSRKGTKKRKRDDMTGGAEGASTAKDSAEESAIPSSAHGSAPNAPDAAHNRRSWKERRKFLPPQPYEESFSLFSTIRSFLLSLPSLAAVSGSSTASNASSSASSSQTNLNGGASLSEIVAHIAANATLASQTPFGLTLEQFIRLAVSTLLQPPSGLGFALQARRHQLITIGAHQDENSSSVSSLPAGSHSVPFLKRSDGRILATSKDLDNHQLKFLWNLPHAHPQNDFLESLETLFFFATTRSYFTADASSLDWDQARLAKATLTLTPPTEEAIVEFRAQEANRFLVPDMPFTYTFNKPLPGHSSKVISMPNPKVHAPGRKGALLKADRPEVVSSASLMRDALARLPGGVGTRLDVASLVLQSQYLAPEITDVSQVAQPVASAFDRMQLEYYASVRYDADLRLYIYVHRQRSESDFITAAQRIERIKKGDTAELWAAVHANSESSHQLPLSALNSMLQSDSIRM